MRARVTGRRLRAVTLPVVLAAVVLLVGGCGGGGDADAGGGQGQGVSARAGSAPAQAPGAPEGAPRSLAGEAAAGSPGARTGADRGSSGIQLVDLESRIIRSASVRLEIGKGRLDQTIQQASQVVARHQGIFAGSRTSAPDGGPSEGVVTFRVPNQRFEQAMAELKRLGTYRGETSDSTDVTGQYVDTRSQLDAWRAQERVYLRLMSEARTIGETLAVRQRLDEVQSNINRLQGQLNVLEDRTSMATINLELREPGAAPAPEPSNPFARALAIGVDGLLLMGQAVIVGVMWLGPLALVAWLVVVGLRRARPASRSRPLPPAPPAPQAEG